MPGVCGRGGLIVAEFLPDPKNLEHGFIIDQLTPPQQSHLGFLGAPLPAPFEGPPVTILRGSDRVFAPAASLEAGAVSAAMPLAGDVSGMVGQAVGAEEHDPRNVVGDTAGLSNMGVGDLDAVFSARVRECWPKVMASFMTMMEAGVPTEAGDSGPADG